MGTVHQFARRQEDEQGGAHHSSSPSLPARAIRATYRTGQRWVMELVIGLVQMLIPFVRFFGKISIVASIAVIGIEYSQHWKDINAVWIALIISISLMSFSAFLAYVLARFPQYRSGY